MARAPARRGGECQCIPADQLRQQVADLLADKKLRSATGLGQIASTIGSAIDCVQDLRRIDLSGLDFGRSRTLDRGRGGIDVDRITVTRLQEQLRVQRSVYQADSQQTGRRNTNSETNRSNLASEHCSDGRCETGEAFRSRSRRVDLTAMSLVGPQTDRRAIHRSSSVRLNPRRNRGYRQNCRRDLWMRLARRRLQNRAGRIQARVC